MNPEVPNGSDLPDISPAVNRDEFPGVRLYYLKASCRV